MQPHARKSSHTSRNRRILVSAGAATIAIIYCIVIALWPLSAIAATDQIKTTAAAQQVSLQWPTYGQGALYADGYGMLGTSGATTSVPIASITKIITALTVLAHKPVEVGTAAPTIQFSEADAALYAKYLAEDGVVAPAINGTSISQYDLMQVMLVASANNYAESLAVWAFGSMDAFLVAASSYLASHGLQHTTIADASGFAPGSASTASDLVLLGKLALENPTIAKIVAQPSVSLPGIGTFTTTNVLVGQGKAIGIKTGNTDEAGQCLLFANKTAIDGTEVTLIGALLSGPTRLQVANDASALLTSASDNFSTYAYTKPGQSYATYTAPWGAKTDLVASKEASILTWKGDATKVSTTAPAIKPGQTTILGAYVSVQSGKTSDKTMLNLSQPLAKPSIIWKIIHPVQVIGG